MHLSASLEGMWQLEREPIDLTKRPLPLQELVLVPVGQVRGHLRTHTGQPAERVYLRLVRDRLKHEAAAAILREGYYKEGLTMEGKGGEFLFDRLPSGSYRLLALAVLRDDHDWENAAFVTEVVIGDGEKKTGFIATLPGGFQLPKPVKREKPQYRITGRVVDQSGNPVEQVHVSLNGGGRTYGNELTDETGAFIVHAPERGVYTLAFTDDKHASHVRKDVRDGQHIEVVLDDLVKLSGRVVDAATGDLVERFEVRPFPSPDKWPSSMEMPAIAPGSIRASFHAGGRFTHELPPRRNAILVCAPGYTPAIKLIDGQPLATNGISASWGPIINEEKGCRLFSARSSFSDDGAYSFAQVPPSGVVFSGRLYKESPQRAYFALDVQPTAQGLPGPSPRFSQFVV